ncbi:unnamed protein product [Mytilus edulis]|uniref:B box-type domain-containing protein n=1 Tax=Mytilus edulis TaxID=6550 RepID=A0A8S3UTU9_MYTED|nr:unnamed protein product [Mytilus edulis]
MAAHSLILMSIKYLLVTFIRTFAFIKRSWLQIKLYYVDLVKKEKSTLKLTSGVTTVMKACVQHVLVNTKKFKGTRDHKTIDIKRYKPSIRAINTECDIHGQQLKLYCPSHLMPCCDECISINHSKCTGIKSLEGVVDNTKIEKSTKKIDNDINSTLQILNEIMSNKSINIQRGEEQVDSIKETIGNYRKKINKHLDDLEKKLCQETDTILNQEKIKSIRFKN